MQFKRLKIRKLFDKIVNPLLFYVDKDGNSIFRNYSLFEHDGNMFSQTYTLPQAGKALEYKIHLDKNLKFAGWIITFFIYLILLNSGVSFLSLFLSIILWFVLYFISRNFCANLYKKFLLENYGSYKLVEFSPHISQKKFNDFRYSFYSKITRYIIVILLFFIPSFILSGLIQFNVTYKKPHYKAAINISKLYSLIYPKTKKIYDMEAYAKYMNEDYEGALKNYTDILSKSGKKFDSHDYVRFANMLFLEKKLHGTQSAIDLFNDLITRKKLSIMEQSKMLWMKSIFSIKNNIPDFVEADYNDILMSLSDKDERNRFYINCDKAYMLYLMGEYEKALKLYDVLIPYALEHKNKYKKELQSLQAERGFTKQQIGDKYGASEDFRNSEIPFEEIDSYEPSTSAQGFIVDKF